MARPDLVSLRRAVARAFPALDDPDAAIAGGRVLVDGLVKTNPATQVRASARLVLDQDGTLRGTTKLQPALDRFPVGVGGAVALDAGAAAGGFTDALLAAGAARVYAVDVGHGQLLGRLRQDPRVVVLERTNIADLDAARVPDPVDVVTLDLSYLALAAALPQLDRVRLASGARLVALVKPMFELRLATAPTDDASLADALARARAGAEAAGWAVDDWMHSPQRGSRGAAELFLFARRPGGPG
jgi:23S rRNA (cytidine1920-2'-O)/16S rRNA (cytidine1409-2'-O)-methyltransferase